MSILQEQLNRKTVEFLICTQTGRVRGGFVHQEVAVTGQGGRKDKSKHLESGAGGWVWCGGAPVLQPVAFPACVTLSRWGNCHLYSVPPALTRAFLPAAEHGRGTAAAWRSRRRGAPPSPRAEHGIVRMPCDALCSLLIMQQACGGRQPPAARHSRGCIGIGIPAWMRSATARPPTMRMTPAVPSLCGAEV